VPIPAFGFVEPTRVCDECYTSITSIVNRTSFAESMKPGAKKTSFNIPASTVSSTTRATSDSASAATSIPPSASSSANPASSVANTTTARNSASSSAATSNKRVKNCVCGSPLCICPDDLDDSKERSARTSNPSPPASAAPSKPSVPSSTSSISTATPTFAPTTTTTSSSTFFSPTSYSSTSTHNYDLKGDLNEQARDAVKNGDISGLKQLLNAGANASYIDHTGNTLVHLAAMFNRLDIVLLLVKAGANIHAKNKTSETAIDLAPPALQNKMKSSNFGEP